jgi:hypothetical protein
LTKSGSGVLVLATRRGAFAKRLGRETPTRTDLAAGKLPARPKNGFATEADRMKVVLLRIGTIGEYITRVRFEISN